jgi:hypothetical protein
LQEEPQLSAQALEQLLPQPSVHPPRHVLSQRPEQVKLQLLAQVLLHVADAFFGKPARLKPKMPRVGITILLAIDKKSRRSIFSALFGNLTPVVFFFSFSCMEPASVTNESGAYRNPW